MTRRRPSAHVRRIRTRHGRKARWINPQLRRARPTTRQDAYQQHLYEMADIALMRERARQRREEEQERTFLERLRRDLPPSKSRSPAPPLPWYGLKVTVRKQRRWHPGRRRMRGPVDVLHPKIIKALEGGATVKDVQPMIDAQVNRDFRRGRLSLEEVS